MEKESDLILDGDEADGLLHNDAFNKVVNNLVEETFQRFVNTKPEEKDQREQSYYHYRALVGIVHTLQQRVAVRDEIMAKRDSETNDNSGE